MDGDEHLPNRQQEVAATSGPVISNENATSTLEKPTKIRKTAVPAKTTLEQKQQAELDAEARLQLETVCSKLTPGLEWEGYDGYDGPNPIQFIPSLVKEHTELAAVKFQCHRWFRDELFPLSILILVGANVETIQEIHKLYPDALPQIFDKYIWMCHTPAYSLELILWIAETEPGVLSLHRTYTTLPDQYAIHGVLGRKEPGNHWSDEDSSAFRALSRMAELNPKSLGEEWDADGVCQYPWETILLNNNLSLERRKWFLEIFVSCKDHRYLTFHKPPEQGYTQDQIDIMQVLLPISSSLNIDLTTTTPDLSAQLFGYILDYILKEQSKLKELNLDLTLKLAPRFFLNKMEATSLTKLLKVLPGSVEDLEIIGDGSCLDHEFVDALETVFFNDSKKLKMLELCNLCLLNGHALVRFLSGPAAPDTVKLKQFLIANNWPQDLASLVPGRLGILGTTLEIRTSNCDWLDSFLRDILIAKNLQILEIYVETNNERVTSQFPVISDRLSTIIREMSLISLEFEFIGFPLDLKKLASALGENATIMYLGLGLRHYNDQDLSCLSEVLENKNATVRTTGIYFDTGENARKIKYWTLLNEYNRKEVADPQTSRLRLVELLRAPTGFVRHSPIEIFNIIYGLMRTAPGIWSEE